MSKKTGEILNFRLLKRVLTFTEPYRKQLLFSLIAAILLSFLGPLRPMIINYAIDHYIIVSTPKPKELLQVTLLLFGLLLTEGVAQFYYIFLSTWIGQHVIQDLRARIFKHIMSLKMSYFDKKPIGTLVTRTVSDIETISAIFSEGLLVIIAELLKLIMVITMMFYTDWRLALISLSTIPILLIATTWFKRNIKSSFIQVREQVSRLNAFVQEHIVAMNIVQIFNREEPEYSKFKIVNQKHQDAHIRSIFYYAVFFPIVEILSATSIGLIVWFGGESILAGKSVTPGEIIAFILFIHMMFRPIRQLADRFNILQMGIVGSDRVFKVLDTQDKIIDEGDNYFTALKSPIIFKNVNFSYKDEELVLKDLNFSILPKETTALVGETGSGKTSIINVLNRFYEIQNGSIEINNLSIKQLKLSELRDNIGLIQQEVFLFSDSIFNNVTLYDETISLEEVKQAAKEIDIHNFISSLPNSYDYLVGERGVTLSTGQRQLIAFLRVYVRNPKILILDEATSSIDSNTERLIQNTLKKITENRTTIIIAHRLSTILHAEKILYLKEGRLIEQGNHNELMKKNGSYARMFKKQNK